MKRDPIGLCSFEIEYGYTATRPLTIENAAWRHECQMVSYRLGVPFEQHQGIYAHRYVVYHKRLGNSNAFHLLGKEITIWIVQHGTPQGTPAWGGAVIMHLVNPGRRTNVRLQEVDFEQEIEAQMIADRVPRADGMAYLKARKGIGSLLFNTWWSSCIEAAHRIIADISTGAGDDDEE